MEFLNLPVSLERLISLGFNIFPFISIWLLFVFFYVIIPNKKIDVKVAIVGALISGIIFQLVQIFYLKFQVGMSSYNAIYGSFAALPLFLIGYRSLGPYYCTGQRLHLPGKIQLPLKQVSWSMII